MRDAPPQLGLQARIGSNTGEVVTGTAERLVTGYVVSVAARLEPAAAPREVLLGDRTLQLVHAPVEGEPVEPLALKEKRAPMAASTSVLDATNQTAYRSRDSSMPVGMVPLRSSPVDVASVFSDEAGEGSRFNVFKSSGSASGAHTQCGWVVDNIESEVKELKSRGVTFEEYDTPGFKIVDSIATIGPVKAAYFKDSEVNLLGVVQFN